MFRLFQSIFTGGESGERYGKDLIDKAVERAIRGTDSRLMALSRHSRRLREPVMHTVEYVVALVDRLAPALPLTPAGYGQHPLLQAMFASPASLQQMLDTDSVLREMREQGNLGAKHGLLACQPQTRRVFGIEEENGQVRTDVPQTLISFEQHRIIDVQVDSETLSHQIKRRAFDHILGQLLDLLEQREDSRSHLTAERKLLRHKAELLKSSGWTFNEAGEKPNAAKLEQQLAEIETSINSLGADNQFLDRNADLLAEAFAKPETYLRMEDCTRVLDHRNQERDNLSYPGAREIHYQQLSDSRDAQRVLVRVEIDLTQLQQKDFFSEAARYL
jgi:hypothetical protein